MITIIIITAAVYSRDLRHKQTMMMESMMNLPDDMFRQELLPYLDVHDIVKLDSACMNHEYRPQLLEKIGGVILLGDKEDEYMKASLFKWLGIRRIYLIEMNLRFEDNSSFASSMENDYVDQFRYTQHVVMRGSIRDVTAIFILSHCLFLLSIDISESYDDESSPQITDYTLQSIAEHFTGRLQSLSLSYCWEISDAGLIAISEHCTNLKSLNLGDCCEITDASIISISTHCTGLQFLNLEGCQITDASIISISTHCTVLQSINLQGCHHITDASVFSISENCTGLKRLNVSLTKITDTSLIAIAKNCTGLQLLFTYGCNRLSNSKLRYEFMTVSELRAVLLSIYPSLPI